MIGFVIIHSSASSLLFPFGIPHLVILLVILAVLLQVDMECPDMVFISLLPTVAAWVSLLRLTKELDLFTLSLLVILTGVAIDSTAFITEKQFTPGKTGHWFGRKTFFSYSAIIGVAIGFLVTGCQQAGTQLSSSLLSIKIWLAVTLLSAAILIPSAAYFLIHRRVRQGRYPITIRLAIKTGCAYALFISGCLLLSLTGFLLFTAFPGRRLLWKRKLFFHWLIMWFCRILVFATVRERKIIDENGSAFSTPAVIIANHQSFIDLILLLSLSPYLILLTNDWVWHSPLFGSIVRWADYYPVSSGIEKSLPQLKQMVDRGYSIGVFPEGSRSIDGSIRRFRKGAFYIAGSLDLNIVPILLHGTGEGITKKEYVLNDTALTVRIMKAIPPQRSMDPEALSQQSKETAALFREGYRELQRHRETPAFLSHRVLLRYLFQGGKVLKSARQSLHQHNALLNHFFKLQLNNGILHLGCDVGAITRLLSHRFPSLSILAYDHDPDRINSAGKPHFNNESSSLQFINDEQWRHTRQSFDFCLINLNRVPESILQPFSQFLPAGFSVILYGTKQHKHQQSNPLYAQLDTLLLDSGFCREPHGSEQNSFYIQYTRNIL